MKRKPLGEFLAVKHDRNAFFERIQMSFRLQTPGCKAQMNSNGEILSNVPSFRPMTLAHAKNSFSPNRGECKLSVIHQLKIECCESETSKRFKTKKKNSFTFNLFVSCAILSKLELCDIFFFLKKRNPEEICRQKNTFSLSKVFQQ